MAHVRIYIDTRTFIYIRREYYLEFLNDIISFGERLCIYTLIMYTYTRCVCGVCMWVVCVFVCVCVRARAREYVCTSVNISKRNSECV